MVKDKQVQLKVALYRRVSTEDQGDKYGLDAQRSAIEGIIKSRGQLESGEDAMALAGEAYDYVDEISGTTKIDERPEFRRLKEDLLNAPQGKKPFDVVAVFKVDRFARKLSILMDVIDFFREYNVEFVSATEAIDTSTPFGRAMLGIMGVIAELELETIKERTQKGKLEARKKGIAMGGHAPYGYQKDPNNRLIILESEAEIVRRIFSLFIYQKTSVQKIADLLTDEKILTPDSSAVENKKRKGVGRKLTNPSFWRAERVRDILSDDVYIGVEYIAKTKNGKPIPKAEREPSPYRHEGIILEHIFNLAQQQ
jgi:site-specific DNA recombinase